VDLLLSTDRTFAKILLVCWVFAAISGTQFKDSEPRNDRFVVFEIFSPTTGELV
jgi:hypothetical protein